MMANTQGLPLYDSGQEPAGLVTMSELAARRRKLAPGQRQVATLRYGHSSDRTALYRASEAVPLPPLLAAERTRAVASRKHPRECSVCGKSCREPLNQGNRYGICSACDLEHLLNGLRERRPEVRRRASTWAEGVLASDFLVVDVATIGVKQPPEVAVHKRDAARAVAIMGYGWPEPYWLNLVPQEKPDRLRDLPPGVAVGSWPGLPDVATDDRFRGVPVELVARLISDQLVGRRVIAWSAEPVRALLGDLRHAAVGYGRNDDREWDSVVGFQGSTVGVRQRQVSTEDQLHRQYARWVGEVDVRRKSYEYPGFGYAAQSAPMLDPGDRVVWLLEQTERMAASPERGTEPVRPQ